MKTNIPPPPVQMVDKQGLATRSWWRFFSGGEIMTQKAQNMATTAQGEAATATVLAAIAALADASDSH
ncbi:MAG: hypothetical protein ACREDY_02820, partial [Bradyrhizobium sp.]